MKFLLVSFLIIFTSHSYAQIKTSPKTKKADQAFLSEEYSVAAELYKKAYSKTKNRALKAEITFKQAECYRLSGNTKRAENYYKRAVKTKYPDVMVYLRYAQMLKKNGKYSDALEQYKKYVRLNPTDVRGEKGVKSCQLAVEWEKTPTRYKIALMPIINSNYSDFSPAFGNSDYTEIYFTSSRKGAIGGGVDGRTGESFTDIYKTRINKKAKWQSPVPEMETINTEASEGALYINKRASVMYFTKCKVEKKKQLGCNIYISERKGKLWTESRMLQIKVDSGTTVGHPAVTDDEGMVFFSSDQKGGYGGKDIWVTKRVKRNQWSTPMNLGPAINTDGDEMFPFIHSDGTLYFASDGHVGMGGLDIFKSVPDSNLSFTSVVNLKSPVNSPADDFGMIIERKNERGYFTSNRVGGKGGDDIYQFELPPLIFTLNGVVTDSRTGAILSNTKVQLFSPDGVSIDKLTDNTGSYNYPLRPITSYEIIVSAEGYLKRQARITTVGIENNKDFVVDFALDPIIREIILPKIEYDYAKWNLRSKSIEDLDNLIKTLNENSNITIALRSHTDYRGTEEQNQILSQKRADVCINYLIKNGIDPERLKAEGVGENEPYVMEYRNGKLKKGDILTKSFIDRLRKRKQIEQAHQYNRRTAFKVISQDYKAKPKEPKNNKVDGPILEIEGSVKSKVKLNEVVSDDK